MQAEESGSGHFLRLEARKHYLSLRSFCRPHLCTVFFCISQMKIADRPVKDREDIFVRLETYASFKESKLRSRFI